MACEGTFNQNSIQPWARVRDRSIFHLAVETQGAAVTAAARVMIDHPDGTTDEQIWEDGELRGPAPRTLALQGGATYGVRVRVGFSAPDEEEAVIAAHIEKPDGSTHGLPYRYCVSGTNGDAGRATITIATRS